MIGVGGSSLIAAMLIFTCRKEGVLASVVAGLIMAGFTVVEVAMLRQGVSWIESLYFEPGLVISSLTAYLRSVENRRHHLQIGHT